MVEKWQDKQVLFEDYETKPRCMCILWEHHVMCLNVWTGKLEDPESECVAIPSTIKTIFVVGDVGASKGAVAPAGDEPVDWTMDQGLEEGHTEVSRKNVVVGND